MGATLLAIVLLGPTAMAQQARPLELLGRLPAAGLFPDDAALLSRIRSLARRPGGE